MPRWIAISLVTLTALGLSVPVGAESNEPRTLEATITAAAAWGGIAPELLAAVVWVESRGQPWALGIAGRALNPSSRAEAATLIGAVGGRADIGIAQIHYPTWGSAFGVQPEDLLDPWVNLHVAARILRLAMDQEPGSWGGVGRYHSATPWRKWWYARRVATVVNAFRGPTLLPGGRLQP